MQGNVLYTSRSPIPHCKKFSRGIGRECASGGIFGFRWKLLQWFTRTPESPLERFGGLRQQSSVRQRRLSADRADTLRPYVSVDSPEDIALVEKQHGVRPLLGLVQIARAFMERNIPYQTDQLARYFARNRVAWPQFYESERVIIDRLNLDRRRTILDIGCGCGGLGLALQEQFGVRAYTGVEINPQAADAGRAMNPTGRIFCRRHPGSG